MSLYTTLRANQAALALRAAARADLKCGDIVTVRDVTGTWRLTNTLENGNFWANKVGSPATRIFNRARCTPVIAVSA